MSEINVDPMKKSSIYATFGRYYGEKLYKLLYDCCSGRPGSFCYEVLKCLGVSPQGDSAKFLNQQGNWVYISGSEPIEVTYQELLTLISTNKLIEGRKYLITDFQTVTYIQFSGGGIGSEEIHLGDIEPMIVEAISSSELATQIWSTVYPTDIITWKPIFDDREWDAVLGQSTGIITSREDTIYKVKRYFDWRNVIFRRWETIENSGVFDSITPTGFNYEDYDPFPNPSFGVYIGGYLITSQFVGLPYWLDNTLIFGDATFTTINFAYGNTILGNGGDNVCEFLINVLTYEDWDTNRSVSGFNVIAKTIFGNRSGSITNCLNPNLQISQNICKTINGLDFDGIASGNNLWNLNNITSSNIGCKVQENVGSEIRDISNIQSFNNNSFSMLTNIDCDGYDFDFNQGSQISTGIAFGLSLGGDILNSKGIDFSDTTTNADILQHTFLAKVANKTITPTASMQSTSPTISLYDTGLGEQVEQILTSGVITYSSAITS